MAALSDTLPLWMKLDECAGQLRRLHRLQPDSRRIQPYHGAQMHHVPTLVLCLAGQTRLIYERDQRLDLNAGEGVLIAPGVFHEHSSLRKGCIVLQQGMTPRFSDFHLQSSETHFIGYIPLNRVESIFYGIIEDRRERQQQWLTDLRSVCLSILHDHVDSTHSVPPAFHKMFHHFVRYVYEGAGTEDIIAVSGLSRSRAYKIWSDCYGSPLRAAIAQQRLYLAKLLMQTELSLEDIASRCGFSSRQQMTRLFQDQEGCSPRAWRRQL